jgi:hypothetical protein
MRARNAPETEAETFGRYTGHYAAAVAEALIDDGLSVGITSASGPKMVWDDPREEGGPDVEVFQDAKATLSFGEEFRRRVAPGKGCELTWEASSGWYFAIDDVELSYDEYLARARWLGAGLVPAPERVTRFVSEVQLDHTSAGSTERPYYRTEGQNPQDVMDRLKPYVSMSMYSASARDDVSWQDRHDSNRGLIVGRQVVAAMTGTPGEQWVNVPLRASELEALRRIHELMEMAAPRSALDKLAYLLGSDLRSRLTGREKPDEHQDALAEAIRLEEHWKKYLPPQ